MTTKHILVLIPLCATIALGQIDTSKPPPAAAATFESAGTVETKKFIPAELMTGSLHKVGARADNDNLVNTYTLFAEGTEFEVATGLALTTRIREVYAIDALRKMKAGKEVVGGAAAAGGQTVKSAVGIVKNPFGTVKSVPKGASRFFGRIGEGMKGGKSEGEKSGMLQGITGVTDAKVALAAKLGVNPYSLNQELQKELTKNARAAAAGGLLVKGATSVVAGPAGSILTVVGVNQTLQDAIINSSPEDLRIMNRKKLFDLGVDREQADEFLMHPWYSPWQEAILSDAIATAGVNPNAFLAQACKALTEEDATYFQRLAQVLAAYKATKAPLRSIQVENGIVCAIDSEGSLVVPISCDYAIWAEKPAGRVEAFVALRQSRPEIKGLALWVDGKVSDRGLDELKKRQIDVVTGVLDKSSKPSAP
jgi:hypothetical protein